MEIQIHEKSVFILKHPQGGKLTHLSLYQAGGNPEDSHFQIIFLNKDVLVLSGFLCI